MASSTNTSYIDSYVVVVCCLCVCVCVCGFLLLLLLFFVCVFWCVVFFLGGWGGSPQRKHSRVQVATVVVCLVFHMTAHL